MINGEPRLFVRAEMVVYIRCSGDVQRLWLRSVQVLELLVLVPEELEMEGSHDTSMPNTHARTEGLLHQLYIA